MPKKLLGVFVLFCLVGAVCPGVRAQGSATPAANGPAVLEPPPPAAALPYAQFDVKAATDAYLATVPPDKRARSDAYFEGGYWLIFWDFLVLAGIMLLLLQTRLSARMRDFAEHLTRRKPLQSAIYWVQFLLLVVVLDFPMTVYEGYFREHRYGLATQTFGPWMRDQLVGLAVGLVLGGVAVMALFGIVRRLGRNWWVWGAGFGLLFTAFSSLIAPVYLAPLFNSYVPLKDARIREPILSMARANGIPATEVYETDTSRQSTRATAFVFGFLGTQRIVLGDNMLKESLEGIMSVMGHEMGHYVLNHAYKDMLFTGVVLVIAFALLHRSLEWSLARWGTRWGIRGITDLAVLPLATLVLAIFGFVLTPVANSWTRAQEYEADIFGLNAAQQPDGEARVDLKLGEYRKLDPGPIEEMLFFDHPSGRTRITAAMRWKKEHLPGAPLGPAR